MKVKKLLLAATAAASLCAIPAAAQAKSTAITNWAGWFATAPPGHRFAGVATFFRVPRVSCTKAGQNVSLWAGLGGVPSVSSSNAALEQAGIIAVCVGGGKHVTPRYVGFHEAWPRPPQVSWSDPVQAGDTIEIFISYPDQIHYNGRYYSDVSDETQGWRGVDTAYMTCPVGKFDTAPSWAKYSKWIVVRSCADRTAEVEAEQIPAGIPGITQPGLLHMATFGSVTFTHSGTLIEGAVRWTALAGSRSDASSVTGSGRITSGPLTFQNGDSSFTDSHHSR